MTDRGHGKIRLAHNAKIIVLPTCAACGKLSTVCVCGKPFKRPA